MRAIQMHLQALLAGAAASMSTAAPASAGPAPSSAAFSPSAGSTVSRRSGSSISYGARASARPAGWPCHRPRSRPSTCCAGPSSSGRVRRRRSEPARPRRADWLQSGDAREPAEFAPPGPAGSTPALDASERRAAAAAAHVRSAARSAAARRSSATSSGSTASSTSAASAFARTSGCRKNGSRPTACPASPCRSTWRTRG